jgi:4-hydroxy-3-polyprenylbenzoate decarboxylase
MLGSHPMLLAYSGSGVASLEECEYDSLGGLLGEPFEVTDGPVTGLPIDANAEMVLEGHVPAGVLEEEGPFGEFPGYYSPASMKEVMDVEAVHNRPNFIISGTTAGRPVSDNHVFSLIVNTASSWRLLREAGVTGLNAVACPEGCGGLFTAAVSLKPQYPGHAMEVGRMTWGKIVIVVDEDIDPFNLDEVLWAVNYRYQPDRGTMITYEPRHTPLDPSVEKDRKRTTSKIIIDATRPLDWEEGFPKEVDMDDGVIEKVKNRWPEIFGEEFVK